jgi:hypothetical protein
VEDAAVAGSEEFGFVAGEFGAEAEQKHGCVGADLLDRAGGVDADGKLLVGEELGENGEEADAVEAAALDEGQGAGSAEGAGGVGGTSPNGLELDVPHALKEEFVLLVLEGGEGLGGVVFGPALRVRFDWIVEEAGEGGDEIWSKA